MLTSGNFDITYEIYHDNQTDRDAFGESVAVITGVVYVGGVQVYRRAIGIETGADDDEQALIDSLASTFGKALSRCLTPSNGLIR